MTDGSEPKNEIFNVVIHDLNRTPAGFEIDKGDSALIVTPTMQRLVDQLSILYGKRTGKSHGRFEADKVNYPVQVFLDGYYIVKTKGFYETTLEMMKTLKQHAQGTASTGGHVFIAHIHRENRDYMLVVMLNDELGAAITGKKDVEDSVHLDVKGFRLAGRVELTQWSKGGDKYISFLKGKGQERVSDYFKTFLGCDNTVAALTETQNLISALEEFTSSKSMDDAARDDFLRSAYTICKRYADQDTPFEIAAFANEIWPQAPEELADSLAEAETKISDGFVPDKRPLRTLVKFFGKMPFWKIEFDRKAINQGQILFDPATETLTIRDLPPELLSRLQDEYEEDGAQD
jgi:nucleoid-associated protein